MRKNKLEGIRLYNGFWFRSCFFEELIMAAGIFGIDGRIFLISEFVRYGPNFQILEGDPLKILKAYGLSLRRATLKGNETIIRAIDEGNPIFVGIDCFYYPLRTDLYQKRHEPHFILIYGYDQDTQEFDALDHEYANSLRFHVRKVPMSYVLQAEHAYSEGICKRKHTSMTLEQKGPRAENIVRMFLKRARLSSSIQNLKFVMTIIRKFVMDGGECLLEKSKELSEYFIKIEQKKRCLYFGNLFSDSPQIHKAIEKTFEIATFLKSVFYRFFTWKDLAFLEQHRARITEKLDEYEKEEIELIQEVQRRL